MHLCDLISTYDLCSDQTLLELPDRISRKPGFEFAGRAIFARIGSGMPRLPVGATLDKTWSAAIAGSLHCFGGCSPDRDYIVPCRRHSRELIA